MSNPLEQQEDISYIPINHELQHLPQVQELGVIYEGQRLNEGEVFIDGEVYKPEKVNQFAQVPKHIQRYAIPMEAQAVFMGLMMRMDGRTGYAFASIEDLRDDFMYYKRDKKGVLVRDERGELIEVRPGKDRISAALFALARARLIEVYKRKYSDKRAKKTKYKIMLRYGVIVDQPGRDEDLAMMKLDPQEVIEARKNFASLIQVRDIPESGTSTYPNQVQSIYKDVLTRATTKKSEPKKPQTGTGIPDVIKAASNEKRNKNRMNQELSSIRALLEKKGIIQKKYDKL